MWSEKYLLHYLKKTMLKISSPLRMDQGQDDNKENIHQGQDVRLPKSEEKCFDPLISDQDVKSTEILSSCQEIAKVDVKPQTKVEEFSSGTPLTTSPGSPVTDFNTLPSDTTIIIKDEHPIDLPNCEEKDSGNPHENSAPVFDESEKCEHTFINHSETAVLDNKDQALNETFQVTEKNISRNSAELEESLLNITKTYASVEDLVTSTATLVSDSSNRSLNTSLNNTQLSELNNTNTCPNKTFAEQTEVQKIPCDHSERIEISNSPPSISDIHADNTFIELVRASSETSSSTGSAVTVVERIRESLNTTDNLETPSEKEDTAEQLKEDQNISEDFLTNSESPKADESPLELDISENIGTNSENSSVKESTFELNITQNITTDSVKELTVYGNIKEERPESPPIELNTTETAINSDSTPAKESSIHVVKTEEIEKDNSAEITEEFKPNLTKEESVHITDEFKTNLIKEESIHITEELKPNLTKGESIHVTETSKQLPNESVDTASLKKEENPSIINTVDTKPSALELQHVQAPVVVETPVKEENRQDLDEALKIERKKMEEINEKLQHDFSATKLELNATQQAKAILELEVSKKDEIILKTEAESLKKEQQYLQEIKALKEQLKEKEHSINEKESKDPCKNLEEALKEAKAKEHDFIKVLEEYEKTIATRFSDYKKLKEENASVNRHLNNLEMSFSDLHQKYEKAKGIILGFKRNEDKLREGFAKYEETFHIQEGRYESLKAHAQSQIDKCNLEINQYKEKSESEIMKLKAINKRLEIKIAALETSLEQKTKECMALAALCDEVTGAD